MNEDHDDPVGDDPRLITIARVECRKGDPNGPPMRITLDEFLEMQRVEHARMFREAQEQAEAWIQLQLGAKVH